MRSVRQPFSLDESVPRIELVKIIFGVNGPEVEFDLLDMYPLPERLKIVLAANGMAASLGGSSNYQVGDSGNLVSVLSFRDLPYYFACFDFIRPLKRKTGDARMQQCCAGLVVAVYPQASNFQPRCLVSPLKARLNRLKDFDQLDKRRLQVFQRDLNQVILRQYSAKDMVVPRETLFDIKVVGTLSQLEKTVTNALLKVAEPTFSEIERYLQTKGSRLDETTIKEGLKGLETRGLIFRQLKGKTVYFKPYSPYQQTGTRR
ncbi:MAG: hypothetical protein ACFFCO_10465 [Promethearchaeota archaeon]